MIRSYFVIVWYLCNFSLDFGPEVAGILCSLYLIFICDVCLLYRKWTEPWMRHLFDCLKVEQFIEVNFLLTGHVLCVLLYQTSRFVCCVKLVPSLPKAYCKALYFLSGVWTLSVLATVITVMLRKEIFNKSSNFWTLVLKFEFDSHTLSIRIWQWNLSTVVTINNTFLLLLLFPLHCQSY